ncbi:hypothetical protein [Flammeovirga aprica]|uniref:Methyltransferase FkbM domain-containing protein n=1 Tax=Flammeovirga aprica JL-4 TaxID=694437 RepID=A0A7X9RTH6_9BACT|nr:hypothetical protein [Flammeovirga aprica]NME68431.1 hypothetical protein [Flammeovirga aprica JL-4]
MHSIAKRILSREEFTNKPPVLVDVGASGEIHAKWKEIAPYCICIAFDADDRKFDISEEDNQGFKKLYKFNCIVSDQEVEKLDFYLTKSPYCSSTLLPNPDSVKDYIFSPFFELDRTIQLNNISISHALEKLSLGYIDWLKTDSQGIDLRIWRSLDTSIQDNTLAIDFEPGLTQTYNGEDNASSILNYMADKNFWLSEYEVQKVIRGNHETYENLFSGAINKRLAKVTLKKAPLWVEISYLNNLEKENIDIRDFLLGLLFTIINKEYVVALELARKGKELFSDPIFNEIEKDVYSKIKKNFWSEAFVDEVVKKFKSIF